MADTDTNIFEQQFSEDDAIGEADEKTGPVKRVWVENVVVTIFRRKSKREHGPSYYYEPSGPKKRYYDEDEEQSKYTEIQRPQEALYAAEALRKAYHWIQEKRGEQLRGG